MDLTIYYLINVSIMMAFINYSTAGSEIVVKVPHNDDALLPCDVTATSTEAPSYVIQWFRREEKIPIFIDIKVGNHPIQIDSSLENRMSMLDVTSQFASLKIGNVTKDDAGEYLCKVLLLRNETKPISYNSTVTLVVTAPPSFLVTPPPTQQGREGSSLLLPCVASGIPTPVITWMKKDWNENERIITNGMNGIEVTPSGALKITSLKRSHDGKYTCRAQSVEGQVQSNTRVYVLAPPVIYVNPQDTTVREGQGAEFNCKARGYPTDVKYTWYHNASPVVTSSPFQGRFQVFDGGTIIIYDVRTSDRGRFTCEATNGFGPVPPTASATLMVEFKARAMQIPPIAYAGLSRTVELFCPSTALPPVNKVIWRKSGRVLKVQQNPRLATNGNGSLIIHSVQPRDHGSYTCTPFNSIGSAGESNSTMLVIKEPPHFTNQPQPRIEVKVGSPLEIDCAGDGDPMPTVSWRKVWTKRRNKLMFCVDDGSLVIKAIRKQHHGMWKCVLSNAVGDVTTDVMIIVTHSSPHPVNDVEAVAVDDSSIRLTWVPGFDGGFPQHFTIWYKRADMGDHTWLKLHVPGNRKVAVINQLISGTIYQFAISPENIQGSGTFSETVSVKTNDVTTTVLPTPNMVMAPSALTSSSGENGRVTIAWNPLCCMENLLGYLLEYRLMERSPTPGNDPVMSSSFENVRVTKVKNRPSRANTLQSAHVRSFLSSLTRHKRSPLLTEWMKLDTTSSNVTSYEIKSHQMYRDQIYEFQILAVTTTEYSQPSKPMIVSTEGLTAYPLYIEIISTTSISLLERPVAVGILSGVLFICLVVVVTVACICRARAMKTKGRKTIADTTASEKCNDSGIAFGKQSSDAIIDLRHVATDDGFSSSFLENQSNERLASLNKKTDDHKEESFQVEIYSDAEESALQCESPSSSQHSARGYRWGREKERRRSNDEESVNLRRETAAKVLLAQRTEREIAISRLRDNAVSSHELQCNFISTPVYSNLARRDRIFSATLPSHSSPLIRKHSAIIRQVSFEDRRRQVATNDTDESVFGVVGTTEKQGQPSTSLTQTAERESGKASVQKFNLVSLVHDTSTLRHNYTSRRDHGDVGSISVGHMIDSKLHRPPLYSSSPIRSPLQVRHLASIVTSSLVTNNRAASVSPDRMRSLRHPGSRASFSFEYGRDRFIRRQRQRHDTSQYSNGDQPSFEIDCSESNIEVRYLGARETACNGRDSSTCKVGSNSVDQSTKVYFSSGASIMKNCNQLHGTGILESKPRTQTEYPNKTVLEASLSSVVSSTTIENRGRSFVRQRRSMASPHVDMFALEKQCYNVQRPGKDTPPLKQQIKQNFKDTPKKLNSFNYSFNSPKTSSSSLPHRPKPKPENHFKLSKKDSDLINLKPLSSISSHPPHPPTIHPPLDNYYVSRQLNDDVDVINVSRPTMISLSDIPWEDARRSQSSGFSLSPSSPNSSNISPMKSTSILPPTSYCRSSERSDKLKQLSLPLTSALCSFSNSIKSNSLQRAADKKISFSRAPRIVFSEEEKEEAKKPCSKPGIRSLPVSPLNKSTQFVSFSNSCDGKSDVTNGIVASNKQSSLFTTSSNSCHITPATSFPHHHQQSEPVSAENTTRDTTRSPPSSGRNTADRIRRDTSSVEDNYEWDSEYAMESEILQALKNFENLKPTSSMSEELRDQLSKFASEATSGHYPSSTSFDPNRTTSSLPAEHHRTPSNNAIQTKDEKNSLEKRCAALREEFLHFRRMQEKESDNNKK